jgi:hypothetical protein
MTIEEAIRTAPTMQRAAALVGIPFMTFKRKAQALGLYEPRRENRDLGFGRVPSNKIPLDEILQGLHPTYNTGHLKRRLLKEGILEERCVCGQGPTWNGKPLVLQLEHKNGKNNDHRLANLEILCPNCHTQTETFAGRNKGFIGE